MGTLEQVLAMPSGSIKFGLQGVIFAPAALVLIVAIAARVEDQG